MNDLDRLEIHLQSQTDEEVAYGHEEMESWMSANQPLAPETYARCAVILDAHERELLARMPREAALELLNAAKLVAA